MSWNSSPTLQRHCGASRKTQLSTSSTVVNDRDFTLLSRGPHFSISYSRITSLDVFLWGDQSSSPSRRAGHGENRGKSSREYWLRFKVSPTNRPRWNLSHSERRSPNSIRST